MARTFGSVLHFRSLSAATAPTEFLLPAKPLAGSFKLSSSRELSSSLVYLRHLNACRSPVVQRAVAVNQEQTERLQSDVVVTETKLPRSSVRLNVEVPTSISEQCYKEVLLEISKRAKIPGFRPGKKIPENILVNYVGKQQVQNATIEAILKKTLPNATSTVEGRALKDTIRIDTKFSEMDERFSLNDIFRYDVLVDIAPEVKWIKESGYKGLKVVVAIDNEILAETAAELELKRRHKSLGALKIVTDRGLEDGDLAVIDIFATTINEDQSDGEKIPSAETKGFHLDTDECSNLLPGFLDSLKGIRQGETKSFLLTFPESWEQENLRGICARFTAVCKEHFYRDLPALDDSIAEKLLPGCSTIEQVKESLLQRCSEIEQNAKEQATDNAILDQLCKLIEVDIPKSLFEEQGRELYGAQLLELQARRAIDENQLSYLSSEKAVQEFLEIQKEKIENVVKQMLAIGEIFRRENLQLLTEDLVREVENSIEEFKRQNQEYDEERIKQQVQEVLEGAKVLEWLRENSDIEYVYR
ncbi:trigger factor type chaperone family protein [Wolffia australiana]